MTLEDLKALPVYQTRAINAAGEDEATLFYLLECVNRFQAGDFGEVPAEDAEANMNELESGEGRALGRYKKAHKLEGDIYINAYFSESNPGELDFNNTMIMYCSEY